MDVSYRAVVVDKSGVEGVIVDTGALEDSYAQVSVLLGDGRQVQIPSGMLTEREDGTYSIPVNLSDFSTQSTSDLEGVDAKESMRIPLVAEELQVGKRAVETGRIRITKSVHSHEEMVDVPLEEEEIEVKRVPLNRIIDAPVSVHHEGDTMIVPVMKEILVVQKQLVLQEELHITRKRKVVRQPKEVTLRSEEVTVERVKPHEPE